MAVSNLIYEQIENKNRTKIVEVKTLDEFKHRLNQMDLLISSKMHPAVLGVSGFVPTLCIAYDHKQIGFFNILEMPECLVEINEVTSDNLISILDYINTNKNQLREKLQEKIPELQNVLRETMEKSLFKLLNVESET